MSLIHIAHYKKLLTKPHKLRHILPEKGKRRISNDNIRLFQQFNTFTTPEIPISLEIPNADLAGIRYSITILIAKILKPNRPLTVVLAEKVALLILVASSYKPF